MLCELSELTGNAVSDFVVAWGVLTLLGGLSMAILSGGVFYCSYARPTFEQWQWKLNPEFPEPAKVRLEIKQMLKSLLAATLCPAAALLLSQKKFSGVAHAYCSVAPKGEVPWGLSAQAYLAVQFVIFWVGSDFYEWAYHQVGHRVSWCWNIHRHHHVFYNPSPFSVISDEWADQIVRTAPLLVWPLLMPTNMNLLFAQFSLMFYAYGVYLHWGFESPLISAHNPIVNGAYEHWFHHAFSGAKTPIYTGFFFKLWDQMVGTTQQQACVCSRCEVARGKRSKKEWEQLAKPDYSVLLKPSFWMEAEAAAEASAEKGGRPAKSAVHSAAAKRRQK